MDALSLPVAISTAAAAISKNLSADELALLAAVFTQLGDTLATIAVTRSIQQS